MKIPTRMSYNFIGFKYKKKSVKPELRVQIQSMIFFYKIPIQKDTSGSNNTTAHQRWRSETGFGKFYPGSKYKKLIMKVKRTDFYVDFSLGWHQNQTIPNHIRDENPDPDSTYFFLNNEITSCLYYRGVDPKYRS